MQLMTAHRSKGLQWRLVVVAGVQEGAWPDLRRRGSLLEPDRLGPDGLVRAAVRRVRCWPRSAGCSTSRSPGPGSGWWSPRSQAPEADGDQPSRLLAELGVPLKPVPGPAASAVVAGRAGRRPALHAAATRRRRRRCGGPRPTGWPRLAAATDDAGRAAGAGRRPGPLVGRARADRVRALPVVAPDAAGAAVRQLADHDGGLPADRGSCSARRRRRDREHDGDRLRHGAARARRRGRVRAAAGRPGRAERHGWTGSGTSSSSRRTGSPSGSGPRPSRRCAGSSPGTAAGRTASCSAPRWTFLVGCRTRSARR